jgi:hypothetical protein
MGIGNNQLHPGQPSRLERPQKRRPERAILAVTNVQAEDFPAAVGGHAGGNDDRAADHAAVDPGLEVGGVQEQVRETDVG